MNGTSEQTYVNFSETLLSETRYLENNFEILMNRIKNADRVAVWGTGAAGRIVGQYLMDHGLTPDCFVHSSPAAKGETLMGIPLCFKEDFYQLFPDALVLLACNYEYQIHKELSSQRYSHYAYMDPTYIALKHGNAMEILKNSADKINMVYSSLMDEKSKMVFENVLKHYLVYDLDLMKSIYDKNQYFGNDLISDVTGPVIDCGAFVGDTLQQMMSFIKNKEIKYYALEPDKGSYLQLKALVETNEWTDVIPLNLGAWKDRGKVRFTDGGSGITQITEAGAVEIDVDSIDHILGGQPVGFIKMDIEGAEMMALNGAKEAIQQFKPTLAISAYHKLEDLWEIPLWIQGLDLGYQIGYRHHMWNLADTVCYGVPSES